MAEELNWGLPFIVHLSLVGLSAGALFTSAFLLLRGGREGVYFRVARYGAFIAPIPVLIDGPVLIAELGTFQAGYWFKFLNLFTTITWSPMSIGSWLLLLFIGVSVVYAFTFLQKGAAPGDRWSALRTKMAWIGVPLAFAVGTYPGIMLAVMPSRPFWNSALIPVVFLLSAIAMGIASIVLIRVLAPREADNPEAESEYRDNNYRLMTSNVLLLGGQLLLLLLFIVIATQTVGSVSHAIPLILAGGVLATTFWLWVVVVGLLVPIVLGLILIIPRLAGKAYVGIRGIEFVVPVSILVGAFMLRYVVVVAGQISGPVGI